MKKLLLFVIITLLFSCTPKDETAMLEQETVQAKRAGINKEIEKYKIQLDKAPNDYERAVASNQIAQLQSEKGNAALMLEYAQKAVKYQPNLYMSRYLLGKSYNEVGRYDDAIKELEESIQLKSDFALAHYELGNALYKNYKYPQAIEEYLQAITLNPKFYQAMNNAALLYAETGKYAEAEKYFKNAIAAKSNFPTPYKNLGILYETRLKNKALAIEYYSKYLKVRPNAPDRKMTESWIKALGGAL